MKIAPDQLLLISALLLRFFLSAFFYHPDLKSQNFHAQFLSHGVFNIYDYLQARRESLPYTDTYNYPPLIYFFQGTWQILTKSLVGPGLTTWLNDWGEEAQLHSGLSGYLLILKLPYLLADFLTLRLLLLLARPRDKTRLALLWLFNPVSLYAIYMIGQFDIFPVLLTVLTLYMSTRRRFLLAGLSLGLGAALKSYPLALLPILILSFRSYKSSLSLVSGSLIGWGIPLLPFILSPEFSRLVLQSQFSASVKLPLFLLLYLAILVTSLIKNNHFSLPAQFLAVTLSLLIFTDFHAQWLLWCIPFLCLVMVKNSLFLKLGLGLMCLGLLTVAFLPDQYILLGQFAPLNPYLSYIPALSSFIPRSQLLRFWSQILFAAFGLLIIFHLHVPAQKDSH